MVGRVAGGTPIVGVVTTIYDDIGAVLKDHAAYFRPHFKDYYGLTMLVKKSLTIKEEGDIFVYKDKGYIYEEEVGNHARNLQYATIETKKGLRIVMNFHGLWNGKGKADSDERLLQSDNIVRFAKDISNPYVLCGDFNLTPETESLKKLEESGMRNLIKEFNITSTRSSHYTKPIRFADYALVSEGVEVKDFRVLPDEVSDHLAMCLEFE